MENESCSTAWVDLKTLVEPYSNPQTSLLGPQKDKNDPKIKSKSNIRIEGNKENENKLGLSWAKLSQSWGYGFCWDKVEDWWLNLSLKLMFNVEVSSLKIKLNMMLDIEISGLCFDLKFEI